MNQVIIKKLIAYLCVFELFSSVILPPQSLAIDSNETQKILKDASPILAIERKPEKTKAKKTTALTFSVINLAAIALFAPSFVQHCRTQKSVWVFAGAAGIYIALEIFNWTKYSDTVDADMIIYNNDKVDQQRAAIEQAYKQTKKAADALKSKSTNTKIALVGFALAGIVALFEKYMALTTPGSDQCGYEGEERVNKIKKPVSFFPKIFEKSLQLLMLHAQAQTQTPEVSQKKKKEKMSAIPEAMGLVTGAVGGLLAMRSQAVTKILKKTDGLKRAVIFEAFALLSGATGAKLARAAKAMNKRAEQYKNLLDTYDKRLSAPSNIATGAVTTIKNFIPKKTIIDDKAKGAREQGCVTGSLRQVNIDKACACQKTKSCKQTNIPVLGFDGISVPNSVSTTAGILDRTGNSLFNGDEAGATANANALLKRGAALKKIKKQLQKQVGNKLGKNLFLAKRAKEQLKLITDASKENIKKLSSSAQRALADFGSGMTGPLESGVSDNEKQADLKKKEPINANFSSQGQKGGANKVNDDNGLQFFLDDKDDNKHGNDKNGNAGDISSQDSLKDLNFNAQDISYHKSVNIFKILTIRYQKSGYGKLFREKKKP